MKWRNETWKIKDLQSFAKNPRTLSKIQAEHLEKSIKNFGQCQPIVINTDGLVIGGHQRLKTMKRLGYKEVAVIVPEELLTPSQIEELNIRLNRNNGDWDWDILANAWEMDDLLEFGFSPEDLQLDLPDVEGESGGAEDTMKCEIILVCASKRELEQLEVKLEDALIQFPDVTKKVKVK